MGNCKKEKTMINVILATAIVLIVGGAGAYIHKSKKRGDTCVGCPHAKACGGKCGGCY